MLAAVPIFFLQKSNLRWPFSSNIFLVTYSWLCVKLRDCIVEGTLPQNNYPICSAVLKINAWTSTISSMNKLLFDNFSKAWSLNLPKITLFFKLNICASEVLFLYPPKVCFLTNTLPSVKLLSPVFQLAFPTQSKVSSAIIQHPKGSLRVGTPVTTSQSDHNNLSKELDHAARGVESVVSSKLVPSGTPCPVDPWPDSCNAFSLIVYTPDKQVT